MLLDRPIWQIGLVIIPIAVLILLLARWVLQFFILTEYPLGFLLILVPLLVIASVFFIIAGGLIIILLYGLLVAVNHFIVAYLGVKTVGKVIHSQRCDNDEDACLCGIYTYKDQWGWEHKCKFRICIHWPSHEQWEQVKQSYGKGAENPVYYLRWLPFIHEIQFAI